MKFLILSVFFFFFLIQSIHSSSGPLKLIKSIGDERDDYTIFGLADAILTEKKDIFILNGKGNFIAHYDWQGNFKRRIGQKGQGPADFFYPRNLAYHINRLYILDYGNHRIAEMDLGTAKFHYYKSSVKNRLENMRHVIDNTSFLGIFSTIQKARGRIGILDSQGNLKVSFFNEIPIKMDLGNGTVEFKSGMSVEHTMRNMVINDSSKPVCDYDEHTGEILVSFRQPDNPILFFVYDVKGRLLKKFSFTVKDKRYGLSRFFLDSSPEKLMNLKNWPERFSLDLKVCIYKGYYLGFLAMKHYKKGEKESDFRKYRCIIFDKEGNVHKNLELNEHLVIIRQSNGYLLGSILEEEVDKLGIYQLNLNE